MSKTPVSILQEIMVKKKIMPNYELIHDGGGTHINTFVYQVSCDGLTASGTGRSKKDAKHEAAKAMLEAIAANRGYPQLPASPAQSPIRTPLPPTVPEVQRLPPNVPFVNAIGDLKDLCAENNLNEPVYEQVNDVGPPHAKIFTIECKVAAFVEAGVARTKKQAKHEAAKKMLNKLRDLVPDLSSLSIQELDENSINMCNDIAKVRYPALSRLTHTKKIKLGIKPSEYHCVLKNSFDSEKHIEIIEKLETLTPLDNISISNEFVNELLRKFKDFLASINLDGEIISLPAKHPNKYIVGMKLDTIPELIQLSVSDTKTNALFKAIVKSIESLKLLLK